MALVYRSTCSADSQKMAILSKAMTETVKRKWLIGLIAVTSLPSLLFVQFPSLPTARSLELYASAITGYLGVMLLLWMYVIGARSVYGFWFRDIAPIMRIHRLLGTYGAIAILLHPILIILSYGESILYTVVPQLGNQFERHVTLGRLSFLLFAVVWLSSALLRKKIGYRTWKYIHYLAYICLPFALLHIPGIGTQFMSAYAIKIYFFGIVMTYVVVTLLRLRGFLNSDKFPYRIVRHGVIADDTYLLDLMPDDQQSWPEPGQFVYLKLGFLSEDHPFSVIQTNQNDGTLTLAYRSGGRFTDYLKTLAAKTPVYVSDPHGSFLEPLAYTSTPTVFIAGGIGITPFMQYILENGPDNSDMWLFYANRTRASSAFSTELRHSLGNRSIAVLNQEDAIGPFEENGYINVEILQKYLSGPKRYMYFICGPEGLMKASKTALESLDVPPEHIHFEAFDF